MFTRLSLRFRIFAFFCLMALGAAMLAGVALWFGWSRGYAGLPAGPFVTAFVLFALLNTGLAVGIWLLFDENVAKPINKLAADLRLRAHSGVDGPMEVEAARYLGDLAPAACALTSTLSSGVMDTATQVARETERLRAQSEKLTALLTEIPVATLLINPAHEIVLYDGQAADVLSRIATPRLKAPLTDYFDAEALLAAVQQLTQDKAEVSFKLRDVNRSLSFDARIKALDDDGFMVVIETDTHVRPHPEARPLVFDFDLINTGETRAISDTPLRDLCYVAFDTETTGLSVAQDDIVQIGAVRVLNGRIVAGEVIDTFVDPERPIPSASTRIHGVTDADVSGAPEITSAGRHLHDFARDAVLIAHNAPFDIGLLRRVEGRVGVVWDHPVLDTVLLSAVVFGTTETHSLDALCARLAVDIPDALRHTALGDAQATAQAFVKLLPLLEGKGLSTFGAVLAETQKHGRLLQDLN
ncbi:MAG: exonuclease domain-containing protein [Sulfitobacter sp.]